MQIDVLIVGQGLAGSLLAWRLLTSGIKVVVVDNAACNASRVAAGLLNPVTGQRLVKTHGVDDYLPEAMLLYRQLSIQFQQNFFVAKPMWRVLVSTKLRQLAEQRLTDAAYQDYLEAIVDREATIPIRAEYGLLRQRNTGYLRTVPLLDNIRDWLTAHRAYLESEFDYNELKLLPGLRWRQFNPAHIVFCEGYRVQHNPWFGPLPLQPAKGEILRCRGDVNDSNAIVNYGYWMIPEDNGEFKTGASFDTKHVDLCKTDPARQSLLNALAQVIPKLAGSEVIEQSVGIRPATLDKQPFVGAHPRYPNLHIFNGFGAKGSLVIPFFARRLLENLRNGIPLPPSCDIKRYYDTHFLN